jgi:hypothetical protein
VKCCSRPPRPDARAVVKIMHACWQHDQYRGASGTFYHQSESCLHCAFCPTASSRGSVSRRRQLSATTVSSVDGAPLEPHEHACREWSPHAPHTAGQVTPLV